MTGDSRAHPLYLPRSAGTCRPYGPRCIRCGAGTALRNPASGSQIAAIRPYLGVSGLYGRDPVNFMADVQGLQLGPSEAPPMA